MDAIVKALGRIESLLARSVNPPPKHGGGIPPWHMWGNTQQIPLIVQSPTNPLTLTAGQLVRISYKRPETWHWVFSARLIQGEDADALAPIEVDVHFDLTIGIGRSILQMPGQAGYFDERNDPSFERFRFTWGGGVATNPAFPQGAQIYSTAVFAPAREFFNGPVPTKSTAVINEIVAQDIQLNCRASAVTNPGAIHTGKQVTIEVSAHFAPKVHLRPEWHLHHFPAGEEA